MRSLEIVKRALDAAASATGGYPFIIQLVGQHSFRHVADGVIDETSVQRRTHHSARAN